jgi:hypothetical protein
MMRERQERKAQTKKLIIIALREGSCDPSLSMLSASPLPSILLFCPVLGFPIQNTINECKKRRLSFLKRTRSKISLFQRIIQERTREGRVGLL